MATPKPHNAAEAEYYARFSLGGQRAKVAARKQVELEEEIHAIRNMPWHRKRAEQRREARKRASDRKEDNVRQNRQNRINRGLPVFASPTRSDINSHENARQTLLDKLKSRTKRGVLEQVISSGGLHAFKEKTITNHAGQALPTDYDWSWRQKEFRPEERTTDHIDRMVGRMIAKHDEELQNQLVQDRKTWVQAQNKSAINWQDSGSGSSGAAGRSSSVTGAEPKASKKPSFAKALAQMKRKNFNYSNVKGLNEEVAAASHITLSVKNNTPAPQALAEDVAPFIDKNDDPAGLLRSLSGYLTEKFNMEKTLNFIEAGIEDNADGLSRDEDTSDRSTAISQTANFDPDWSKTFAKDTEFSTDDTHTVPNGGKVNDKSQFNVALSIAWLNGILEETATEVFVEAKSRFKMKGKHIPLEDVEFLYDQVIGGIKKEWNIRMFLEDDKASKKSLPISLGPFRKEFGPLFDDVLLDAMSHVPTTIDTLDTLDIEGDTEYEIIHKSNGKAEVEPSSHRSGSSVLENNSNRGDSHLTGRHSEDLLQEARQGAIKVLLGDLVDGIDVAARNSVLNRRLGTNWKNRFLKASFEAIQQQQINLDPTQARQSTASTVARSVANSYNHAGRSYVPDPSISRQTHPQAWPIINTGLDKDLVTKMEKSLSRDTYETMADAEIAEQTYAWNRYNQIVKDRIQQPQLMDFDNTETRIDFHNYNDRILHDEIIPQAEDYRPMSIDQRDSHIISRTWPLQFDGEASQYSREPLDLDTRDDAYNGSEITPSNPLSGPSDNGDGENDVGGDGGGKSPSPPAHRLNSSGSRRGGVSIQAQGFGGTSNQPRGKSTSLNLNQHYPLDLSPMVMKTTALTRDKFTRHKVKPRPRKGSKNYLEARKDETDQQSKHREIGDTEGLAEIAARQERDEKNRQKAIDYRRLTEEMTETGRRLEGQIREPALGHDNLSTMSNLNAEVQATAVIIGPQKRDSSNIVDHEQTAASSVVSETFRERTFTSSIKMSPTEAISSGGNPCVTSTTEQPSLTDDIVQKTISKESENDRHSKKNPDQSTTEDGKRSSVQTEIEQLSSVQNLSPKRKRSDISSEEKKSSIIDINTKNSGTLNETISSSIAATVLTASSRASKIPCKGLERPVDNEQAVREHSKKGDSSLNGPQTLTSRQTSVQPELVTSKSLPGKKGRNVTSAKKPPSTPNALCLKAPSWDAAPKPDLTTAAASNGKGTSDSIINAPEAAKRSRRMSNGSEGSDVQVSGKRERAAVTPSNFINNAGKAIRRNIGPKQRKK